MDVTGLVLGASIAGFLVSAYFATLRPAYFVEGRMAASIQVILTGYASQFACLSLTRLIK